MKYTLLLFTLFIATFFANAYSQVTVNVVIAEPSRLQVNAGVDVNYIQSGVTLGNDVVIKGGTADYSYKWFSLNGFQNENMITTVTYPGKYYFQVTDVNNCTSVDSLIVLNPTAISQKTADKIVSVYPNPTSNSINFSFDHSISNADISIISEAGVIVYKKSYTNVYKESIDLQSLTNGVYYVHIKSDGIDVVKDIILRK